MGVGAQKSGQFNILAPCPKSLSLLEFAALFLPTRCLGSLSHVQETAWHVFQRSFH
ncbi:hypothetical protein EMIT0P171_170050 [Pseudomonas sp. IT-P171]